MIITSDGFHGMIHLIPFAILLFALLSLIYENILICKPMNSFHCTSYFGFNFTNNFVL